MQWEEQGLPYFVSHQVSKYFVSDGMGGGCATQKGEGKQN
jgi:hypothetical protein